MDLQLKVLLDEYIYRIYFIWMNLLLYELYLEQI